MNFIINLTLKAVYDLFSHSFFLKILKNIKSLLSLSKRKQTKHQEEKYLKIQSQNRWTRQIKDN